ncbi:hypothetical protein [Bdellovibrio svalbardensis]|uniref:Uncharacterized protein n=1 Tax=Bdellovibrio svalbardensis TaxID=2972972 RepID=A0ABT6DE23_9BACT|nr:hypothetical protein [Bdellovibrio svalbardensis]MDG0815063.1 hypothetical protein [Bdellovibrio svalbardensis]
MKKLGVCLLTAFIFGVFATSPYAFGDESATKAPVTDKSDIQSAREAADGGYDKEAGDVKAMLAEINQLAVSITEAQAQIPRAAIKKALGHAGYYSMYHGTCTSTQSTAGDICRERTSPQLQNTLNSINTVASMITGVAVKDSCSTFAKIAKLGQMGLTAYTAACSAARAACEASCSTVKSNLDSLINSKIETFSTCIPQGLNADLIANKVLCEKYSAQVNSLISKINPILTSDAKKEDVKSVAMKNIACTYDYANMIVSAGTGIASMIAGLKQGQSCDEESNGTAGTTAAADLRATCEKAENAQMPECLCLANPRLPGCANALQKAGDSSTSNFSALSSPNAGAGSDRSGAGLDLSGGDSGRDPASDFNKSADSAGGVGAPTGGGAGFGGSGGGFGGGGAAGAGGSDKKGLNANILGGSSGGGGGGGSWGSGGSSSDSKLRPYLPGGEKDPNKMAGQQNWTKEVTGQGGKSNWEKVRDRYRDNNSTLLNN